MHPENKNNTQFDELKIENIKISNPYITFNNGSQIYVIPTAPKPLKMVFEHDDFATGDYKHEAFEAIMDRVKAFNNNNPTAIYGTNRDFLTAKDSFWDLFVPCENKPKKKIINAFETEE